MNNLVTRTFIVPFLKLCFQFFRPFLYFYKGGALYAALILFSNFLFLKSLLLLSKLPSLSFFALNDLARDLQPWLLYGSAILAALLQMLVINIISSRIIYVERGLPATKILRNFLRATMWGFSSGLYCGIRALAFLGIIFGLNYAWKVGNFFENFSGRYLILLALIVICLYLYAKIITLFFAVITSMLTLSGAKNSIRLVLLCPRTKRTVALLWFTIFLSGGFFFQVLLKKMPELANLLSEHQNLTLVFQSILIWYILCQTTLNLIDGLIAVERKIRSEHQQQPTPPPPAPKQSKIDNLVISDE